MKYAVINISDGICINVIIWDGASPWTPPVGKNVQQSDLINIGDQCELNDGVWTKI